MFSFLIAHSAIVFDIWAFLALMFCLVTGAYWGRELHGLKKEKDELTDNLDVRD